MNINTNKFLSSFNLQLREEWEMEKRVRNDQLVMIHKRNKLMLVVFIILTVLDLITNFFIFPEILLSIMIATFLCCALAFYFVKRPKLAEVGMYAIVSTSFFPFWIVAYIDKDLINYFFLTMPLIMSSMYNRVLPILLASLFTCISVTYFYFDYYELVFNDYLKEDVLYFLLFTLSITVVLIFSSRMTGSLLLKAAQKEQQTQEALMQSEKLSVIGELAAGVAHEIRNPVTVLKGFVQLLSRQKTINDPFYYNIMEKELERINQITNEFMALAKPQAVEIKLQNVRALINEVCNFLEGEAFIHQAEIIVDDNEEAVWVECEPNQIKQVLINTIKNGIEAMPGGGKIVIQLVQLDQFVHLHIKDEGKGIPAEILEKIGQPFFTTKEEGTGLGLMVSMKIIENHGGLMSIHSQEKIGTTAKIQLPYNQ